jgi:hypothetical protein
MLSVRQFPANISCQGDMMAGLAVSQADDHLESERIAVADSLDLDQFMPSL